jgi:hypothetical protein
MVDNMLALSKSGWANDIGTTLYQLLGMTLARWETQWWPNEVTNQSVGPTTDCDLGYAKYMFRYPHCKGSNVYWDQPLKQSFWATAMTMLYTVCRISWKWRWRLNKWRSRCPNFDIDFIIENWYDCSPKDQTTCIHCNALVNLVLDTTLR